MKLIVVAAAALALVAGSVDVEAHCGECKLDKSGGDKESLGGGRTASEKHGRPLHLARLAVAHFDGLTGEDRTRLIEEARNGDETAQEELEAAVTAGLERVSELLDDVKTRRLLKLGITLGLIGNHDNPYSEPEASDVLDRENLSTHGTDVVNNTLVDLEEQIMKLNTLGAFELY